MEASETPSETSASNRAAIVRVFALIAGYLLIGVAQGIFVKEKVTFLLKEEVGLSAGATTTLNLLINVPVYCQPLMGAYTEIVPLFGSRRRSYFALATLVSALAYFALALLPHYRLNATASCLLIAMAGYAMRNTLLNAVGIAQGNRIGNYKAVQTLLQLMPLILVAAFTGRWGGIVTEHWSYRAAFIGAALVTLSLLALIPLMEEPQGIPVKPNRGRDAESARIRKALLWKTLADRRLWAIIAFVAYVGFIPSPDTARPYFFADSLHFSKTFIGELNGWSSAGAIIGILLMQFAPRNLRLRPLAVLVTIGNILLFFPLLMVHNATTAIIGMVSTNVITYIAIFSANWMYSRACPKGLEAVVFGALAATGSLFYLICDWLGTNMYDWFGPASGHSAAYGWHWSLIACTALSLPLLFFLPFLPKADPADDELLA